MWIFALVSGFVALKIILQYTLKNFTVLPGMILVFALKI
jgi:hypothetical protein